MCDCRGLLSDHVAFTDTKEPLVCCAADDQNLKELCVEVVAKEIPAVTVGSLMFSMQQLTALWLWKSSVNRILCSIVDHFTTKVNSCRQRAASLAEGRVNWTHTFVCPHQLESKYLIHARKRASGRQIDGKRCVLVLLCFSSKRSGCSKELMAWFSC